jgi:hypothetical protein
MLIYRIFNLVTCIICIKLNWMYCPDAFPKISFQGCLEIAIQDLAISEAL